jgi:LUD domain
MSNLPVTRLGLPIDRQFQSPASPEQIQRAGLALSTEGGFVVEIVGTVARARATVHDLMSQGDSVLTVSSQTLRLSGLEADINESGRYDALRPKLLALRAEGRMKDVRAVGSSPDVVVGSVHAVTEDGRIVVASASGSQIGPYCYGAARCILVVGAQKIVPDVATALQRVETYAYPLEDLRVNDETGNRSTLGKILIFNREWIPNRTTVVICKAAVGF